MAKKILLLAFVVTLVGTAVFAWTQRENVSAPGNSQSNTRASTKPATDKTAGFDKTKYSTSNPASLWVVVNKQRPLNPRDYAPQLADPNVPLTQAAGTENMKIGQAMAPDFEAMFAAAKSQGVNLALASGYRSYTTQVSVYGREVSNNGQANADTVSARPGFSEHQTGLAADVSPAGGGCIIEACFGATKEGVWVRDNAWQYGFIVRYTSDKTAITGYSPEPWHIRYVGKDLAAEMHRTGIKTLEEFFNLGAAPSYH